MASFKFLPFLLLAIYASIAQAAPWPIHARHATHRVRHIGRRALKLDTFQPKGTYKIFGAEGIAQDTGNSFAKTGINDSAIAFVQSQLGVDPAQVGYRSGLDGGAGKFAYVKQTHEGVPFVNAVANVAWKNTKVVAFGSSFVDTKNIAPSKPSIDVNTVIPTVEEALDGQFNGQEPTIEYLAREDGSVALTHVVQVRNEDAGTWFEAYVCAHTGEILSVTDFVAHASYTVLPITKQAFPDGQEKLVDPADLLASPFAWHSDGIENTTSTIGNNVAAFANQTASNQTSAGLNFNTKYDDSFDPTTRSNMDAAVTNAFYIINTVHDFSYRYGFTESAFNFQDNNFDKGGRGGDSVLMSVQDKSGLNNANFATPPDGQSGTCRMFIWDQTNPRRDGSLENDIIVHEMTHGITNRMTGGGTGRCLQTVEAGGMGEGWSDAMAEWVLQKSDKVEDFIMGQYVLGSTQGIRQFPYSTNPNTNPLRYSSIRELTEVHNIGEVWANMLHNVYAALVAERGFSKTALTNPDTTEGNVVYMHLFMDALLLQPCNPTFVSARDAWIQADENRYNGANKCTLFKAFASRGLGLNAADNFVDNEDIPLGC
ncbi:Fungalysin metallopeptidase-domain-containing protein [Collybia nuda]|uniref:Extracellular metalloproteinase n=1 Tax=Collybia nuda TaxID=64659 RepID=A0A9P5Y0V6_9AGAR|nr:Fungalysin metallopeptidase-domain-containing protein [Collybia nuda]